MRRVGPDHFAFPARDRAGGDRVEVRRIEDFELVASFDPGVVAALAADPAGTVIGVADREGAVRLWDARSGDAIATVIASEVPAEALSFSSDGRWIAARDMSFDVHINRLDQPPDAARRLGLSGGIPLVFHPHLPIIAVDLGSQIGVYDVESATKLREISTPAALNLQASELCFSADGSLLLSGSFQDGALDLWDFAGGRHLARIGELGDHAFSLDFHPNGERFSACRSNAGAVFSLG